MTARRVGKSHDLALRFWDRVLNATKREVHIVMTPSGSKIVTIEHRNAPDKMHECMTEGQFRNLYENSWETEATDDLGYRIQDFIPLPKPCGCVEPQICVQCDVRARS